MTTAFIALGANLGEPFRALGWAREQLAALGTVTGVSRLYRTAPVGGPPGQPPYLNAALRLETGLSPADLLAALHATEARAGRTRHERWEARVLDLDLILYGDLISEEGGSKVGPLLPHPHAWDRAFVLAPLADLEAHRPHPRTGETVTNALARVGTAGIELVADDWG